MSTTRHASEGSPLAYERYMSSPEFAALRALPGNLVAAKAQLFRERRHREMLYWLQAVPCGLAALNNLLVIC